MGDNGFTVWDNQSPDMIKWTVRILLGLLSIAVLIAAVWGILYLLKKKKKATEQAPPVAGWRGKTAITSKENDDNSVDRIVTGMEGTDGKTKTLVAMAFHEVGHAICGTLIVGHDAVQKVTLIPRCQARGLTSFIHREFSKKKLFARVVGGRADEEIIEVTTGLTRQMVTTFGMSEIGLWFPIDSSAQSDVIMRKMARNSMPEKLAEDIDAAVKKISDSAYELALSRTVADLGFPYERGWISRGVAPFPHRAVTGAT